MKKLISIIFITSLCFANYIFSCEEDDVKIKINNEIFSVPKVIINNEKCPFFYNLFKENFKISKNDDDTIKLFNVYKDSFVIILEYLQFSDVFLDNLSPKDIFLLKKSAEYLCMSDFVQLIKNRTEGEKIVYKLDKSLDLYYSKDDSKTSFEEYRSHGEACKRYLYKCPFCEKKKKRCWKLEEFLYHMEFEHKKTCKFRLIKKNDEYEIGIINIVYL